MSGPRRGLGRGLSALIPAAETPAIGPTVVPLASIRPNPKQPRRHFDEAELQALADSIRANGVLQPLVVVRETGGGITLVAGERRLRACRLLGLEVVPVVFREPVDEREALALSLVENIQRHDLNALEEAEAYRQLIEDFGLTQEAAARQVGRSRVHVANSLRLLTLAAAVRSALLGGAIAAGHARAIASLPPESQEVALRRILRDELNVRETEALARQLAGERPTLAPSHGARPEPTPDVLALERAFRDALQAKVRLVRRRRGGRLVIDWSSDEELDALYHRLTGGQPRA